MIVLRSEMTVETVQAIGNDLVVAESAWVSTGREADAAKVDGLIRYLMRHRHGTPFEHGSMTFLVECPIFVAREFFRHRIGWSYNETSGRYRKLDPEFWVPRADRPLVNVGSSARPRMGPGDPGLHEILGSRMEFVYKAAWAQYELMLRDGVANEVARSVLPVGTFTSFFATCNPRSLMHFLSLRVHNPDATFISYPQAEIQEVAELMESRFAERWPITHRAFLDNGRVAP